MARLVIGEAVPDGEQWAFQAVNTLTLIRQTKKALTYADAEGDTISFKGKNLKYEEGEFSGGRVTEVVVRNSQADLYGRVTGLDLKAADMFMNFPPGPTPIREETLAGNDTIIGSTGNDLVYAGRGNDQVKGKAGDDRLHGMEGNDVLTGGGGTDSFYFLYIGPFGRDRITDFDVETEQLVFHTADFLKIKDGRDTILAFEDGSRVYLEDVKPTEFTSENFWVMPG